MKTKIFLNSLLAVVIGLCVFVPGTFAAAFGISPPWITNENLKAGSNFVYVIDLSTNDPSETMTVKTAVSGDPEVISWVKVRDADTLTMPAGLQHVPMYIDVNVPKDAKTGKYTGDIMVSVIPQITSTVNVSIYLGGHIAVKLEVVNYDVTDFMVKSTNIEPITEGQTLSMGMQIKNLGNTMLSKVNTGIEVTDFTTSAKVATATANMLSQPIQPQAVGDIEISYPMAGLKPGQYWLNIYAMKNGKQVYQNKLYLLVKSNGLNNVLKTSVNVGNGEDFKAAATPFGSLTQPGNNVKVKTSVTVRAPLTNKLIGIVIILLGVLIIVTVRTQKFIFKKFGKRWH